MKCVVSVGEHTTCSVWKCVSITVIVITSDMLRFEIVVKMIGIKYLLAVVATETVYE